MYITSFYGDSLTTDPDKNPGVSIAAPRMQPARIKPVHRPLGNRMKRQYGEAHIAGHLQGKSGMIIELTENFGTGSP